MEGSNVPYKDVSMRCRRQQLAKGPTCTLLRDAPTFASYEQSLTVQLQWGDWVLYAGREHCVTS